MWTIGFHWEKRQKRFYFQTRIFNVKWQVFSLNYYGYDSFLVCYCVSWSWGLWRGGGVTVMLLYCYYWLEFVFNQRTHNLCSTIHEWCDFTQILFIWSIYFCHVYYRWMHRIPPYKKIHSLFIYVDISTQGWVAALRETTFTYFWFSMILWRSRIAIA